MRLYGDLKSTLTGVALGVAGILFGLAVYVIFSDSVARVVNACQGRGNSFEFCWQYNVRWPIVHIANGVAMFSTLGGMLLLATVALLAVRQVLRRDLSTRR